MHTGLVCIVSKTFFSYGHVSFFFFLTMSKWKSLRNNGKKFGQIRRLLWLLFKCYCWISKWRKTVRASKLITKTDNTSKAGYEDTIFLVAVIELQLSIRPFPRPFPHWDSAFVESRTWNHVSPWEENLIILVIYFTYPVNPFIARSGISQLREFPWDRAEFSDYARRLQNWKWIDLRNLHNRLFYSKQNILKLIFSRRLKLNIFESIRTG